MGASVASSSVSEPPKEVGETGRKTKTNKPKRVWDLGETHVSVFPIYADIAAGNGLWISDDSSILDFAEFDHLLIKNQPHKLVNLLGSDSMIRLSRGYLYGISKVVGNSMNLASIESGDYVLFRQLRDLKYQPSNGDIVVAAVIKDGERFGTVKRFRGVRPNESLEPESTESHGSIPFASTEIDIIGQVIAVLKATESD
ncbi:MAG: hypothetical protein HY868_22335 [Chloroflexi bacterium]|nr:hypothetical protein [Chloroflexota bacterium]